MRGEHAADVCLQQRGATPSFSEQSRNNCQLETGELHARGFHVTTQRICSFQEVHSRRCFDWLADDLGTASWQRLLGVDRTAVRPVWIRVWIHVHVKEDPQGSTQVRG